MLKGGSGLFTEECLFGTRMNIISRVLNTTILTYRPTGPLDLTEDLST
jgi:hypothetical protein